MSSGKTSDNNFSLTILKLRKGTKTMAVHYRLYQNKNKKSAFFNKWYGRAVVLDTVTTDQLADTIEANCTVKRADILAVISELVVTMRKELQDSKRVKLDRFGSFKLGISTSPSETVRDFGVNQNLRDIHIIFQPEVKISKEGRRVKAFLEGCKVAELPKNTVRKETAGADVPAV